MKQLTNKRPVLLIREGDQCKTGLHFWGIGLIMVVSITPWFATIKHGFLVWCYGMLVLWLILEIINYVIIGNYTSILLNLDNEGIKVRISGALKCYEWDEIEIVGLKLVRNSRNKRSIELCFFLRPIGEAEVSILISNYVFSISKVIRSIRAIVLEYTRGAVLFQCDVPSFWRRVFFIRDRYIQS